MESPEFIALRADPRYSDINVNGKSVEKHDYKKIKAQTIADLGWSSPETMNIGGHYCVTTGRKTSKPGYNRCSDNSSRRQLL
jgi:hypothetical protein